MNETPPCKTDPRAPHGFDRNASHSADRYVCECEGWEPPKREWVGLTKEDFYKKDDETVFVLGMKFAEARLKEEHMKIRSRIRRNTQPSDHTIGWKKGKPVVRITTVNVELCNRMGVSVEKSEEHMTERQIVNWLLGFVIGILTVLAWQRVMSEPYISQDTETTRAEELISIYKRGAKDALSTNPVNFELEQACLEVWANKQPVEVR
jgi:hypothetical protein